MKLNLLTNIYTELYRIRTIEEAIAKKYSEQKMRCPVHLSIGQEIVSAVFSQVVKKKDFAVSTHRSHAHYLAKGGNLRRMISEIYGKNIEKLYSCTKIGSYHMMPTSRSGLNEGWIKTYQTFHNNNSDWWIKKFEKKFKNVYLVNSSWDDFISLDK